VSGREVDGAVALSGLVEFLTRSKCPLTSAPAVHPPPLHRSPMLSALCSAPSLLIHIVCAQVRQAVDRLSFASLIPAP
jgi:hypothetical protein